MDNKQNVSTKFRKFEVRTFLDEKKPATVMVEMLSKKPPEFASYLTNSIKYAGQAGIDLN